MAPIHPVVREAINLAQAAGWGVNIKPQHSLVTIQPPGQYAPLNLATNPDNEALNKWRGTAKMFGLSGEGPAMTPAEREAAEKAAKTQASKAAAAQREAAKAEQAKQAEIKAAQEKAKQAAEAGLKAPTGKLFLEADVKNGTKAATPAPEQAPAARTPVARKAVAAAPAPARTQGIAPFTPAMLTAPVQELKLADGPFAGRYFCPQCWERGEVWTGKLPQGLAAHRGFRHGAYTTTAPGGSLVAQAVLPQNIVTALELLGGELAETFATLQENAASEEQAKEIAKLQEQIKDLDEKLRREIADHHKTLATASSWKTTAEERGKALADLQAEKDSAAKAVDNDRQRLMASVEKLLTEMRKVVQTQSPVQAVGKVDAMITEYLGD